MVEYRNGTTHCKIFTKIKTKKECCNYRWTKPYTRLQGFVDLNLKINYQEFVHYLKEKYAVKTAYCFLGYNKKQNKTLMQELKKAKIEPLLNKHNYGNADANIAFTTTKMLYEGNFDKIIFISGDGDFILW